MNEPHASRIKYDHLFLLWNDWDHRCKLCFIFFMITCSIYAGCENKDSQSKTEQESSEQTQMAGDQIENSSVAGMQMENTQQGGVQAGPTRSSPLQASFAC